MITFTNCYLFKNIIQKLVIFVEGVNEVVHLFLAVVLLGSMPSPLLGHGQCGSLPLLYLPPPSLCVAVRACLSQLTGEGSKDPTETTETEQSELCI
jgi:hypothetical protein